MKINYFFIILAAFTSLSVTANDDNNKVKCEYSSAALDGFPTKHESLKSLSLKVGPLLCRQILLIDEEEKEQFETALFDYSDLAIKIIKTTYPEKSFPGINNITEQWEFQLKNYSLQLDFVNPIRFSPYDAGRNAGNERFTLRAKLPPENNNNVVWVLGNDEEAICKKTALDMSCKEAAKSINNALNPAFSLLNSAIAKNNGELIGGLQSDWKNFIKNARYQTPLDVWATTALQSDYFHGSDLVGPPKWQAFLLRPSIVFEHVDEADKGSKNDVSIALEWVGVNWWKKGVGVSLTSIYNDRKEIDSVGHGLTFHIKNKYSFGYVHRNDDNGSFFFNIDLLEFFGENKDVYKKYKQYLK